MLAHFHGEHKNEYICANVCELYAHVSPSFSQVEVKAVPVSQKKSMQQECMRKLQRLPGSANPSSSGTADLTFGGLPMPKLDATYEPMIVKEARYIAITMMKVGQP